MVTVRASRFAPRNLRTSSSRRIAWTLQFDRAVQRFLDPDLGHDVGRVIRHVGLHQRWRQSDRLPIGCPLGDAPHKLEKLRSPNARVWDQRGFDQILLRDLRVEVTTGEQAVGARRPTAPRDVRRLRLLPRRGDCDPTFSKNSKTASSPFQKSRSAIIRFIYSCKLILLAGPNCRRHELIPRQLLTLNRGSIERRPSRGGGLRLANWLLVYDVIFAALYK